MTTTATETKAISKKDMNLRQMLATVDTRKRFEDILGKEAPAFISSIIAAVNANPGLEECQPGSVVAAAAIAATLHLPITPGLGQAHIVPYKKKGIPVAQFQMGWKGFVQLAHRTEKYKTIHATDILEGQLVHVDRFTGDVQFQEAAKSQKVIGYLCYFKLLNGFEKYLYMTVAQLEAHAKRYSKTYQLGYGQWKEDFPNMALKTVVKLNLSKFGILSTDLRRGIEADQAIVKDDGTLTYADAIETTAETQTEPLKQPQMTAEAQKEARAETITQAQEHELYVVAKKHKVDDKDFGNYCTAVLGVPEPSLIESKDFERVKKWLSGELA